MGDLKTLATFRLNVWLIIEKNAANCHCILSTHDEVLDNRRTKDALGDDYKIGWD